MARFGCKQKLVLLHLSKPRVDLAKSGEAVRGNCSFPRAGGHTTAADQPARQAILIPSSIMGYGDLFLSSEASE